MTPLSITITIAAYFVILFAVAAVTGRKADNAGFFSGNRQSKWYVVAFAMIGASISGVTFVSVPGMVGTSQFGYLQMVMGFIAGQMVIAFVLTPLFYKMKLVSVYQFLEQRFGMMSYHTGAWFFFISKILGAAVRLYLVCLTLQLLVFAPWGLPFSLNVALSMLLVWIYTFRGGVKSLIWTDSLKTFCLIVSVGLCIYFITKSLGLSVSGILSAIDDSGMEKVFFFSDVNDKQFFFKQFFAGMFTMIATNGIDQDMMQRNLSCKNFRESQKNMMTSIILQFVVITAFLMLGVLLYIFASQKGISVDKADTLFPVIATGGYLPVYVGILFIIGLVSSAYAAAGSALTALTTSFTIDILGVKGMDEHKVASARKKVHLAMAVAMGLAIYAFNIVNNTSVIDAVYVLASYTYGPILGLFAFGIFSKRQVRDRLIPVVAIAAPLLCLLFDKNSEAWFNGYKFSYEILILNALFTYMGMLAISGKPRWKKGVTSLAAVVLAFSICACNSGNAAGSALADGAPHDSTAIFSLPSIPPMLTAPEQRADFLVRHYWDNAVFSDTVLISHADVAEQAWVDYCDLLTHVPLPAAQEAMRTTIERTNANKSVFDFFTQMADLYLYDPNSPMRNEELYIPVLQAMSASPLLTEVEKSRPQALLALALKNRVGTRAINFRYSLANGKQGALYDHHTDFIILFFNDPDCQACAEAAGFLKNSALINSLLEQKVVTLLSVYAGEDEGMWRNHLDAAPGLWVSGYDSPLAIREGRLYNLMAAPTLYLLDKEKTVLLKDATPRAIEDYLSRQ